jgi:hypothetical protein
MDAKKVVDLSSESNMEFKTIVGDCKSCGNTRPILIEPGVCKVCILKVLMSATKVKSPPGTHRNLKRTLGECGFCKKELMNAGKWCVACDECEVAVHVDCFKAGLKKSAQCIVCHPL